MSQVILCLVSVLVEKRNLCFHSPMEAEVSCDRYYGVNLLWCIMAHSMEAYLISSLTVAHVLSPGQRLENQHTDHIRCETLQSVTVVRMTPN